MENGKDSSIRSTTHMNNPIDGATTGPVRKFPRPGYYMRWSRLEKTVQIERNDAGLMGRKSISQSTTVSKVPTNDAPLKSKKVILKQVSGYAAPGEILACMGPSGSGKTSLMNVLSGRSSYQGGAISINRERVDAVTMKRLMAEIAYVKQADIFFGHLTVRDQLTYTALLRMPNMLADNSDPANKESNNQRKHAEVDRILTLLRLWKVADTPISKVSGGEKKRVNIGTELLTDPAVLLLDEPTSGLDSTSAVALLRLLQTLAREHGKTVLTSIHQPSSAVFFSFDRLLLLSEGNVVYFGTPTDSLQYLRQHNLACPDGYNGSDHWMDLLVQDSSIQEEEEAVAAADEERGIVRPKPAAPRMILEQAWDGESVAKEMEQAMNEADNATTVTSDMEFPLNLGKKYNSSWSTQYFILTHRALKNSRSAIFTPLNLCKSFAIGLVAGLLWFQKDYVESDVNDIRSYYFFTMTFWVFDAMFSALAAFPSERTVILKERASGSYHLSAYFMAKTTADAPVRLILPFIYMCVSFWLAGISNSFATFIGTICCTLLSVLSGEAIGLLIGAAVYDLQKGMAIMTVFTLFLMLLGGFFVKNIPKFLVWAKYISPFKYAFDSSLQLVFDHDVPCDGSGALQGLCVLGEATGTVTTSQLYSYFGVQGSVAFNVGMLLVLCFVPRYGAYLALRKKKGGDRS